MTKRIVLVTHATPSRDDRASDHLARLGYELDWRTPCDGDKMGLPDASVAGTIVYGGMYCISEVPDRPFLQDEIIWLRACMDRGLPTLGICQGAQMIAHILGAEVGPPDQPRHEFGYYQVTPTREGQDFLPQPLHMAQHHFHEFQIPDGAVRLAGSDLYDNQAFRWGERVYGVQFHPEVTPKGFTRWQDNSADVYGRTGVQSREQQTHLMAEHDPQMDIWFRGFLDHLFGPATDE